MAKVKYGPREFTKGPVHGMMIYDAAHYIVCIVKPAPSTYPAQLSSQYITILSSRGVPDSVFLELQREAVREELKVIGDVDGWWDNGSLSRAGVNGRMRLAGALEGLAIKKRDAARATRGLGVWKGWGDDREDGNNKASSQSGQPERYNNRVYQEVHYKAYPRNPSEDLLNPKLAKHRSEFYEARRGSQRWEVSRQSPQDSTETSDTESSVSSECSTVVDIWRKDETSGSPPMKCEPLRLAVLEGIDIASSYFLDLWTYTVQDVIRGVVLNMHLPVARSARGFLQPGIYGLYVLSVDTDSPFLSCHQIGPGPWRKGKSYSFPLKRLSTPKLDSYPLQLLVKSWYVIYIYNESFSASFCLGWSASRTSAYGYAESKWVAVVFCSVPHCWSGSRNQPTTAASSLPRFDCILNQRGSTLSRYPLRWG